MEPIMYALYLLMTCLIVTPFVIFAACGIISGYFSAKLKYEQEKIKNAVSALMNKEKSV